MIKRVYMNDKQIQFNFERIGLAGVGFGILTFEQFRDEIKAGKWTFMGIKIEYSEYRFRMSMSVL